MDDDPTQKTTVLQGMGLFKIWTTLILTPLLALALIVGMMFFSTYQKGWHTSTARVITDVKDCPSNSNKTQFSSNSSNASDGDKLDKRKALFVNILQVEADFSSGLLRV
jgi:hypothetical protein